MIQPGAQLVTFAGAGDVSHRDLNSSDSRFDADAGCRGLLVLSDTYFPGWRATIDGKNTEIYDANGIVRAVVLDRGRHTVVMTYRPLPVAIGALMTVIGTLFTIVVVFRNRRY